MEEEEEKEERKGEKGRERRNAKCLDKLTILQQVEMVLHPKSNLHKIVI